MISVYFSIDPTIQTYLYNILLWLQTAVQGYLAGFTSQTTQTYSNEILYPSDYRAIRPEVSSSLASSLRGGKHVETYGSKFSILSTVWLIFVSVWWFQMCFICSAQPYLGCCFFRCFFSRGLKPPSSTKKLAFAGSIDTPILTHTHIRAVWSVSYFRFFQMRDVSFSRILLSFMPATSMTQGWLIISQTFPVVEWSLWSWKLGEGGFVVWRTAHSGLASDHSNKIQETKKNARLWMSQWLYESMVAVIKICANWTLDEVIVIVVIIHIYIYIYHTNGFQCREEYWFLHRYWILWVTRAGPVAMRLPIEWQRIKEEVLRTCFCHRNLGYPPVN